MYGLQAHGAYKGKGTASYIYMCVYIYICIYIYVSIYTYTCFDCGDSQKSAV